jgi:hypothetical protein
MDHPESKDLCFPFMKKPDLATNQQLAEVIKNNSSLMMYIPKDCKIQRLPRSYLCSLLYYVTPEIYEDFALKVRMRKRNKEFNVYSEFDVVLPNEILPVIDAMGIEEVI